MSSSVPEKIKSSTSRLVTYGGGILPFGLDERPRQTLSIGCSESDYPCHIRLAKSKYERILARQSSNVEEAVATYKKKYWKEPPAGFEAWVEFALMNNATFIDEYDTLHEDLEPLRKAKLTKQQIRNRIANALQAQNRYNEKGFLLGKLKVENGKLLLTGRPHGPISVDTMNELLAPILDRLPDVEVLFNWYSESRVLGSSRKELNRKPQRLPSDDSVVFEDYSRQDTWDLVTDACPANHLTKSSASIDRPSIDICSQPASNFRQMHGLFVAPNTFEPTDTLVPMLSRSKISTMRDILTPNPCYAANWYRKWNIHDKQGFREKKKSLYWRGKTTGVFTNDHSWNLGHRQRFVNKMQLYQNVSATLAGMRASEEGETGVGQNLSEEMVEALGRLNPETFDANFTITMDCEARGCEKFAAAFPVINQAKPWFESRNQLVADIDGESMSCRFYRQLGSNSLPLKQTIWAEWHDDWIVPWLHYIPLSLDLHEVPTLLDWLLNTEEGQENAEIMASAGRFLAEQALRPIDLTIYFYRVLLECADLFK